MVDIAGRVKQALIHQLGEETPGIAETTRLSEDLGLDSLDIAELGLLLEDSFGIEIEHEMAQTWTTVGDIIAAIEKRIGASPIEKGVGQAR